MAPAKTGRDKRSKIAVIKLVKMTDYFI